MNLSEIVTALQAHGYGSDTGSIQITLINTVYRQICGKRRWPFLEKQDATMSTVINQPNYTPPMADWLHLDAVRVEDPTNSRWNAVSYLSPQELRDLETLDHDSGYPIYWTFINQEIRFYPKPDQVLTVKIDYIKNPPPLVLNADVPLIPAVYHDLLVWGTIVAMTFRERDYYAHYSAQGIYNQHLTEFLSEYELRQRQTSDQVKRSGVWDQYGNPYWGWGSR